MDYPKYCPKSTFLGEPLFYKSNLLCFSWCLYFVFFFSNSKLLSFSGCHDFVWIDLKHCTVNFSNFTVHLYWKTQVKTCRLGLKDLILLNKPFVCNSNVSVPSQVCLLIMQSKQIISISRAGSFLRYQVCTKSVPSLINVPSCTNLVPLFYQFLRSKFVPSPNDEE